jgi:two-component system sensor histidine kinase/response regulator
MPDEDGFALIEQIRRDPALSDLTVILLTSSDQPEDAARCEQLRVAERLMKPIKQSELFDAIVAALGIAPPEPTSTDVPPAEPPATRPLRILLAEDSIVNQRLAIGLLERHGHRLTIANNGREACDQVENNLFDVVLMDVQMPELDGLEATRTIREREAASGGPHVPIIAMTAHALKGDRERCLEAGMDEYVAKPVRERQLLAALRAVMGGTDDSPLPPDPAEELVTPDKGVINWDEALKICAGDHALLRDIVDAFLEEHPRRMDEIRRGIDAPDFELLNRAAHTIKGSMRYFSASAVFDRAFALEQLGQQQSLEGAEELYGLLKQELARLVPHLINYRSGRGGPSAGS